MTRDVEVCKQEAKEDEKKAVEAVTELIVSTLKEPYGGRFGEARRLCEIAHSLMTARARRAADFQGGVEPGTTTVQYNTNVITTATGTTTTNPIVWVATNGDR